MAEITKNKVGSMLDRMNKFGEDAKGDLMEDILSILTEEEVGNIALTPRERADIMQLIKGNYSTQAFFNALQVTVRVLDDMKIPRIEREILKPLDKKFKFGVELVPSTSIDKIVAYTRKFELGGIDNIWITDHYTNRDPYVTLALVARATDTAELGVGVTNPYMRHLAQTASVIASLDDVSENRMILGLGVGDKSTLGSLNIGMEKPLTTVKETVEVIRSLWDGKGVNFKGDIVAVENARMNFKPSRQIPIYIGAQGPKMLKLAGSIGDGILINASHEMDFEIANRMIREGVSEANRSIGDVDVVAYTSFSVDKDEKEAIKAAVPVVAFIAAGTPQKVLENHGLDVERAMQMKGFIEKGKFGDAFGLVNDSFIDTFSISGTPEHCIDKIENLLGVGVTQFVFGSPLGKTKKDATPLITEKILPAFS